MARVAREVRASGRRPRALYVVSNFANPSGVSLSAGVRRGLIEVAADQDLLILEDDPYGLFGLDDRRDPALKSLDTDQRVIYLGSFAKSVFPGARVGFLVADQAVVSAAGHRSLLADELSTVKSMITVNTSPIAQAVIGGVLVSCGYSLRAANREKIAFYRRNLRALLAALERHFSDPAITWNSPERRLLRRPRRARPRGREAARAVGAGLRRAVDADELLLHRRRRQPRDPAVVQRADR